MINFILAPLFGFLCAGCLKFALNCIRTRTLTLSHIGMGGLPSTHNTITATTASNIGFSQGFDTAAFSIALGLVLIVFIDSVDLRNKLAMHARSINAMNFAQNAPAKPLREKLGHTKTEAFTGLVLGAMAGAFLARMVMS